MASLIKIGQSVCKTVKIPNTSTTTNAKNIVVELTIPTGFSFNPSDAITTHGSVTGTQWTIPILGKGDTAVLEFCFIAEEPCPTGKELKVEVVSAICDIDMTNNSKCIDIDYFTCCDIVECVAGALDTDGTLTIDYQNGQIIFSDAPEMDMFLVENATTGCLDLVSEDQDGVQTVVTASVVCNPVFTDNGDGTCSVDLLNGITKILQEGPITINSGNNTNVVKIDNKTWVVNGCCVAINADGNLAISDVDGNVSIYEGGSVSEIIQIVTSGIPLASHDDGEGNITIIYQVSDSYVYNGDGTWVHTDAAGNPVSMDIKDLISDSGCTDELVDNPNGSYTHTDLAGNPQDILYYHALEPNTKGGTDIVVYNGEGNETSRTDLCNINCPPDIVSAVGDIHTVNKCGPMFFGIFDNDSLCASGAVPLVHVKSISGNNMGGTVGTYGGNAIVSVEDCLSVADLTITYCLECDGYVSPPVDEVFSFVPTPVGSIGLTKSYSVNEAKIGDTLTLTLIVSETSGAGPLTNVEVEDLIDSSIFQVLSSTPSTGSWDNIDTWDGFNLAASASESIVFNLEVIDEDWSSHINIAVATADPDGAGNPNQAYGSDSIIETPDPVANLSIVKSVPAGPYTVGEDIVYTITVSNYGPDAATNVVTTDTYDATTLQYSNDGGAGGSNSGNVWTSASVASIPANGSVVYILTFEALAEGTDVQNVAEAIGDEVAAQDNAQVDVTIVPPSSDLSVTKIVQNTDGSPVTGPLSLGQDYQYLITVVNNGPDDDTNINVLDNIPVETTFVSSNPSSGTWTSPNWTIPSLANGDVETLELVFTATTVGSFIENTATVSGDNNDPNLLNNEDSVTVNIVPLYSDLFVNKTVDNNTPDEGDNITYTISYGNNGPDDDTNVIITDLLPSTLTYVSDTSGGSYNSITGVLPIGSLVNGATGSFDIVATVNTGTGTSTITNSALIEGDNVDNIIANNTSSVDITVNEVIIGNGICDCTSEAYGLSRSGIQMFADGQNICVASSQLTGSGSSSTGMGSNTPAAWSGPFTMEYSFDGGTNWTSLTITDPDNNSGSTCEFSFNTMDYNPTDGLMVKILESGGLTIYEAGIYNIPYTTILANTGDTFVANGGGAWFGTFDCTNGVAPLETYHQVNEPNITLIDVDTIEYSCDGGVTWSPVGTGSSCSVNFAASDTYVEGTFSYRAFNAAGDLIHTQSNTSVVKCV